MTLHEDKFHQLEALYINQADIYPVPCPGLMEFVEQGILEGDQLDNFLKEKIEPYLDKGITGIVLGCTHYPFVRKRIETIAGPSIEVFDGSLGTARELLRRLTVAGLNRKDAHTGQVIFLNSSNDPDKIRLARNLFEREI